MTHESSPPSRLRVPGLSAEERELGMNSDITRRDFLNTVALGTGSALLAAVAPGVVGGLGTTEPQARTPPRHHWTGYGGVGDYAISNGNAWEVVNAGHGIRASCTNRRLLARYRPAKLMISSLSGEDSPVRSLEGGARRLADLPGIARGLAVGLE